MKPIVAAAFCLSASMALVASAESPSAADTRCTSSDCIIYDLSGQDTCTEVTESASYDARWVSLSRQVDQSIKGGRIVAYKLQWFSGSWSGWYVPGVNDMDNKFNVGPGTLRRMWSYFYDHTHSYVICSKTPGAF